MILILMLKLKAKRAIKVKMDIPQLLQLTKMDTGVLMVFQQMSKLKAKRVKLVLKAKKAMLLQSKSVTMDTGLSMVKNQQFQL